MLQRSKSAGKQPNRPGYVPLPATDEQASGSRDRNKSPLPENPQRRTNVPKPGAKPVTKRAIAPGQVRSAPPGNDQLYGVLLLPEAVQ